MSLPTSSIVNEEKREASVLRQALAGMIDIVLILVLVSLLFIYQTPQPLYKLVAPINSTLLVFISLIIYRLFCFVIFKGTLGMKILKVNLLNGQLEPLLLMENIMASFFILYKGVAYYKS